MLFMGVGGRLSTTVAPTIISHKRPSCQCSNCQTKGYQVYRISEEMNGLPRIFVTVTRMSQRENRRKQGQKPNECKSGFHVISHFRKFHLLTSTFHDYHPPEG